MPLTSINSTLVAHALIGPNAIPSVVSLIPDEHQLYIVFLGFLAHSWNQSAFEALHHHHRHYNLYLLHICHFIVTTTSYPTILHITQQQQQGCLAPPPPGPPLSFHL
ncbi:hypothetical protein AAG906_009103 [Vitis piasezkii]